MQGDRGHLDDPRQGRTGTRRPEEDITGGFAHGGWRLRYFDDTFRQWVVHRYAAAGGFLVGAAPSRGWRAAGRTPPRRSRPVALCAAASRSPTAFKRDQRIRAVSCTAPSSTGSSRRSASAARRYLANGQPALACYQGDGERLRRGAVNALGLRDGRIWWLAGFLDPQLLSRFAVPMEVALPDR